MLCPFCLGETEFKTVPVSTGGPPRTVSVCPGCKEPSPGMYLRDYRRFPPVVVSTIQTVYSRLSQLRRDAFNLVVIDESHHASAKTWRAVADHLSTDLRLGLSATPERSDGVPLSNLFDDVVYQMTVAEAITEGYLCRPKGLQVRTGKSLDGIKTRAGDFAQNQLADTVDTPERNALVAAAYVRHAAGRRAVAFAVTIEHAQHLAVALRQAGVNATWVSGDDPDRAEKIAALRSGQCEALCCAMLLTEGFDDPGIGCVLMAIGGFVAAADRRYRRRAIERAAQALPGGQAA